MTAMTPPKDRRRAERRSESEGLAPEYLEVLAVCGGEIRAADRAALAGRRRDGGASGEPTATADVGAEKEESKGEAPKLDRRAARP
jgi:hypothetical protein